MNPYRMLIIDDEAYVCTQLRSCIDWAQLNIEIVGEADNGLSGLALVEKFDPQIVICDIHMPYLDGVSFALQLHERSPSTQIIFISAYSDKEQMQQAIRLNVVDYLFKPYKLSDLSSAVEAAIDRLSTRKTPVPVSSDALIELLDRLSSPADMRSYLDSVAMKVDFSKPFFCMIARPSGSLPNSEVSGLITDNIERQRWMSRFTGRFQALVQSEFNNSCEFTCIDQSCVAFINTGIFSTAEQLQSALSPLLAVSSDSSCAIGISPIFSSVETVQDALVHARLSVFSSFYSGFDKIHLSEAAHSYVRDHESLSRIRNAVHAKDQIEAIEALNYYCTYVSNCSPESIPLVREELIHLISELTSKQDFPSGVPISQFVMNALTLDDIKEHIQRLIQQLAKPSKMDNADHFVLKAENYILSHLDQSLTVRQIAENIYISHTYLCFIYKKKTGKTLNKFITEAKMNQARALLENTDKKIGDISAMLGYSNQNYFSKVFINTYGISPHAYRLRYR